jgi:hypothetical protein
MEDAETVANLRHHEIARDSANVRLWAEVERYNG